MFEYNNNNNNKYDPYLLACLSIMQIIIYGIYKLVFKTPQQHDRTHVLLIWGVMAHAGAGKYECRYPIIVMCINQVMANSRG